MRSIASSVKSGNCRTARVIEHLVYHYDDDLSPDHPDAENTLGLVTYIEDFAGATYFSYDGRENLTGRIRSYSEQGLEFVTRMEYDAMDRSVALTYPDGSVVNYDYSEQGTLDRIPGYVENVDYTAWDAHAEIAYSNGITRTYAYDDRLRLDRLQSFGGQDAIQDLTYGFDARSNITTIVDRRPERTPENDLSQEYAYDGLYRLTDAVGTYGQIDYRYDSIGNMISKTSDAADTRLNLGPIVYGENGAGPHALTSANGIAYTYDANGNLMTKGDVQYEWDVRNRLVAAIDADTSSTYLYDSENQRVLQTVHSLGVVTTTLYPDQVVEVRDGQLIKYVFDDEKRMARTASTFDPDELIQGFGTQTVADTQDTEPGSEETLWYLSDHLGGTNLMTDAEGQVTSEVVYYPYGLTRYESNGTGVRYRFTDKELDASGLYYYGARYHDPVIGRFISVDPLYGERPDLALENPQGLNVYAYTLNNPVRYDDPTGEGWLDVVQTGLDVVGMIPVVGEVADLANAGIYAARGDYANAALSASAAIPIIGTAATGAKLAIKAGKAIKTVKKANNLADTSRTVTKTALKTCSFSAATTVVTVDGEEEISEIQVGDLVLAYDESLGVTGFYTVADAYSSLHQLITFVEFDSGVVETTPEHPFYTNDAGWVPAGLLLPGDQVLISDTSYDTVRRTHTVLGPKEMYKSYGRPSPHFLRR